MSTVHDPPPADYLPPTKRPRISNPPPPAPPYIPGPPGPSTPAIPDQDGAADAASKKNRKRPLSCGECRRLKLKCDRVFPCQSCCKRGCAEICPDGALTGGKGSRFILANTEQLHEKIKSMSGRIRELEVALGEVQPTHRLLREELLLIKKSADLFGVDPQQLQPVPPEVGKRSESISLGLASPPPMLPTERQSHSPSGSSEDYGLPPDIMLLSDRFPAPSALSVDLNPSLRKRIFDLLPPQHEARYLCEQAAVHAGWHQNSDGTDGVPNMLHSIYNPSISTLSPHRLSYFIIILAIGVCVDQRRNHRAWVQDAERYHKLSRAAICETSVINEPSMDAINALFYMARYLMTFSVEKEALEYSWVVLGIAAKLGVAIGLHRCTSRGKVIPEELDMRKTLLWCMVVYDYRLGLMLRRPPSIAMQFVDVDPPCSNEYPQQAQSPRELYQQWHYSFTAKCVLPALEATASPTPPPYADILMLDARIRNFESASFMHQAPASSSSGNGMCLTQTWTHMAREVAILNLHRTYFTQALNEGFWANHKYASSVVAVYQSSLSLLWSLETYYRQQPEYSVRVQVLWANGLSSAVALALLVTRVPPSVMASTALLELAKVLRLFTDVSDRCPMAAKACPVLESMFERARSVYLHGRYGTHHESEEDELCKVSVRVGLVSPPRRPPSLTKGEDVTFPVEGAHTNIVRAYEEAIATVPPPNDPILMPGQLHLVAASSDPGSAPHTAPNGGSSSASTGFGVSAERSGCQNDPYANMGPHADMQSPPPMYGIRTPGPKTAKWHSGDYSEHAWMTWF